MMGVVLAHGGTGGAMAEAALLLFPVVAFLVLSRWSKRRERAEAGAERADAGGQSDNDVAPDPGTDTAP